MNNTLNFKIRKSDADDSDKIAKIHLNSFPNFFLTNLGYSFLRTYYSTCAKNKEAISICAINQKDKKLIGFAVGCLNSKGFNKKIILSNLGPYLFQAIILFFTKPLAIYRLYKNLTKGNSSFDEGNYAELLSIGVLPEKKGLGIGKELLISFEKQLKKQDINSITLTTDFDSNDDVLQFYKKLGYKTYYDFITFPNRKMLKLIKKL